MGYSLDSPSTIKSADLWLVLHDRLLCNANRLKRKLTDDPRYTRCNGNTDETLLHLVCDCPVAKNIWLSVGGTANYESFFTGPLGSWITRNIQGNGLIYSEKWPTCFALTLWWIWRWRNLDVFGRNADIPVEVPSYQQRLRKPGKPLTASK